MVKYICYCQMTPNFLKLPLEKRKAYLPEVRDIAQKYGLKVLFWGSSMGVKEHVVVVFESNGTVNNFIKFQRQWQGIGTPEAGKYLEYTRTITVI